MSSKAASGLDISLSDVKVYLFIFAITKLLQVFGNVIQEKVVSLLLKKYMTRPDGKLNVKLIVTIVTAVVVLLAYVWFSEQEKILHYLNNHSRSTSSTTHSLANKSDSLIPFEEQSTTQQQLPTLAIPIEEFKLPQLLPRIGLLGSFFIILMIWLDLPWNTLVKLSIATGCVVLNLPLIWDSVGMYLMSGSLAIGLVMYASIRKCCLKRKKRKQEQLARKLHNMRSSADDDQDDINGNREQVMKSVKRIDAEKYAVIKKSKKTT